MMYPSNFLKIDAILKNRSDLFIVNKSIRKIEAAEGNLLYIDEVLEVLFLLYMYLCKIH